MEFSKSPAQVFQHVIDLPRWWPEEVEGECSGVGDELVFRSGESHFSRNKVVEFLADRKLSWMTTESIRKPDNFDWSGTKMSFELTPKDGRTLLRFTYDGPVREDERERLAQICDFCIRDSLYNFAESFATTIEVPGSADRVFHVITADVSKWWGGKDLRGSSLRLDDEFVVDHPGTHYTKQKLIECVPGKKVVWLVTEGTLHWLRDQHEWKNTKMIFELSARGGKTVLSFRHEGLVPEKECYTKCEQGWTMVITDWLYNYILHGEVAEQLYR